eukprot:scaffold736_cov197-Ochromonas_danica.AAC.5
MQSKLLPAEKGLFFIVQTSKKRNGKECRKSEIRNPKSGKFESSNVLIFETPKVSLFVGIVLKTATDSEQG